MTTKSSNLDENRQRLGRGLAALLGDVEQAPKTDPRAGVQQVPIETLQPNSRNPRRKFDEAELDDLAASIRMRGILQPIIARTVAGDSNNYQIVAGERRWRAAQRAGLHTVPVILFSMTDRDALEISVIENVQRSDLNALEEAQAYAKLASDYGYNNADIGRVVGKSRSHVANMLRLLTLPAHARELLETGALSAGHARALLPLPDPDQAADRVVAEGLSVRDVERLRNEGKSKAADAPSEKIDLNIQAIERRLSLNLGANVKIESKNNKSRIIIGLTGPDQLNYMCDLLTKCSEN